MYVSVSGWHRRLNKAGKEEKPLYVLIPLLKCEADLVSIQAKLISEGKLSRCQRKKDKKNSRCVKGRKEGNVLFNDALNTFYLRLYGVKHMVKDHSDSEKGNPLPPHRLLFPINSKGSFIGTIPQERDVAQSIACLPLKRSVVGLIHLSGPSCSLGYFPFQPVVHNWFIKGCGMYCSVYGKVHIKDPLLLIEKSSLYGGSGFPSKTCVNMTI